MRRFCPKNCLQVTNRLVVINEQHSIFEQIANFATGQNSYTRLNITYIMRRCRYEKTEGEKGADRRLGRRRIPYRSETDVAFPVDLTNQFFSGDKNFSEEGNFVNHPSPLANVIGCGQGVFSLIFRRTALY